MYCYLPGLVSIDWYKTSVGVSQYCPLKVTSIIFQIICLLVFNLLDCRGNETKKMEYWECLLWFWRSFATEVNKRPLELLLQMQLCCNKWPWGMSFNFSSHVLFLCLWKARWGQYSKEQGAAGLSGADGCYLRNGERKMSGNKKRDVGTSKQWFKTSVGQPLWLFWYISLYQEVGSV